LLVGAQSCELFPDVKQVCPLHMLEQRHAWSCHCWIRPCGRYPCRPVGQSGSWRRSLLFTAVPSYKLALFYLFPILTPITAYDRNLAISNYFFLFYNATFSLCAFSSLT
jgi:hypothetical protein